MPEAGLRLRRQLGDGTATPPGGWAQAAEWGRLPAGAELQAGQPVFPRIDLKSGARGLPDSKDGKEPMTQPASDGLSIQEFQKLDLRVGRILAAERVTGADKLLKLFVDLGEEERTVVAGIAQFYEPESLVGRSVVVVANLVPARIRGVVSQGMVLAADSGQQVVLVSPEQSVPPGSKVR